MTNIPTKEQDIESVFQSISGICLCCSCCCEGLSRYVEFGDVGRLPEFLPKYGQEKCNLCGACVKICPVKARWHHWPLKPDLSDDFIHFEAKNCIGCGLCAYVCSTGSLTMVRAQELTLERT